MARWGVPFTPASGLKFIPSVMTMPFADIDKQKDVIDRVFCLGGNTEDSELIQSVYRNWNGRPYKSLLNYIARIQLKRKHFVDFSESLKFIGKGGEEKMEEKVEEVRSAKIPRDLQDLRLKAGDLKDQVSELSEILCPVLEVAHLAPGTEITTSEETVPLCIEFRAIKDVIVETSAMVVDILERIQL